MSRQSSDGAKAHPDVEGNSSIFTESTNVPRRHLGYLQVTFLMINQAIGNGIITTPAYVLFLTKSKPLSIGLWALGGLYSFLA